MTMQWVEGPSDFISYVYECLNELDGDVRLLEGKLVLGFPEYSEHSLVWIQVYERRKQIEVLTFFHGTGLTHLLEADAKTVVSAVVEWWREMLAEDRRLRAMEEEDEES